jgi:hypothetical protein
MKKSKITKLGIESSSGSPVDLSKYWKNATIYYSDGSTGQMVNVEYLKELDEKYEKILAAIVEKGR